MKQVMEFLTDLAENNNREWFQQNKNRYDESRKKILFLTEVFINEIRKFDSSVPFLQPADCIFRIYRDVRFSHDKRPYKTNLGFFIAKGGRKSMNAGYYIHIEPGGCFVGGGVYMPPAESLKLLREYIAENGAEFLSVINQPDFKKLYPVMFDDKLKTAPKGYSPDHEFIDLLKYKSFAFTHKLSDQEVLGEKYIETVIESFSKLSLVNQLLNSALDN